MKLPEKIRNVLERIIKKKRIEENVYGLGLFGSWARGDATPSSDVDILVLDANNHNEEYVERVENQGVLIDFNYIPKNILKRPIPPELDQKLYEMQILYDRDWSLSNMKLLIVRVYNSPERVEIRIKAHIVEADIYLSRATSAYSVQDYKSAWIFATSAFEEILRVPLEITLKPFSISRFIENLKETAVELNMENLFESYLEIARLSEATKNKVQEKLKTFKNLWDEINHNVKRNSLIFESLHFKVRSRLNYYLNQTFLQGTALRVEYMIKNGKIFDALYYLRKILLAIIENYAWFKTTKMNMRLNYTTLINHLQKLERHNPKNYEEIIKFFDLKDIDKNEITRIVNKTKHTLRDIRLKRKSLIKDYLLKS